MSMQRIRRAAVTVAVLALLPVASSSSVWAAKDGAKRDDHDGVTRLRIVVTAGQSKEPVSQASVYVKFIEKRKVLKNKEIELNLKTNEQGVTRSPEVPQGHILIQIVAPGWQTFGEWYDVATSQKTIHIRLKRPQHLWY